jgi:hypothetical protein
MKNMWSVRLARKEDALAIEMLMRISARVLQSSHYSEAQIEGAIGSVFGLDHQLLSDRTYFVAAHKGQIIGCGGWSKRTTLFGSDAMKTEADTELTPGCDSARIRAFFVHPALGALWHRPDAILCTRRGISIQAVGDYRLAIEGPRRTT